MSNDVTELTEIGTRDAQGAKVTVVYEPEKDRGTIDYDRDGTGFSQVIQFQNGPILDNGHNGIQNEDVLNLLLVRMRVLNKRFPCRENSLAITKMEEALMWLEMRSKLRVEQGVEGKNLAHAS